MNSEIKQQIYNLLNKAGVSGEIELTTPPNPEMGDFAFACFNVAKEWKMSPVEAAKTIESKIKKSNLVDKVQVMGPYVNFYLNPGQVAELVIKDVLKKGKKYGINNSGKGKKVLIEYPSNNTHKEFHIGHLRNVCIGNSLVQLYEQNGYKVYPVNYLNDFGNHVAKCLWGLQKFHKDEKVPENKQKWLGEIYAEASQKLKDNPDFAPEVAEIQKQIEGQDSKIWKLFMQTREWSIDKFEEIFKQLGVKHVAVFYEKDLKDKGQGYVDDLLQKGIAKVGEGGAIILDLSEYKLDIALLRKSNGTGLYMTSDLALAVEKFKGCYADESIIITGTEQNFYFKQLYKTLELMGFDKKLTHISYGLINLKEGKMSSRLGNVILYEDLYAEVYEKLKEESVQRHPEWSEKKIKSNIDVLAMAALKFDMQKHEAAKNIIFDIKEATSFEGFSGLYVLYAIARINSVLNQAKKLKAKVDYNLLNKPEEKQLVLFLAKYEEVVRTALLNYNPSEITRYSFDLAQAFNDFYNKHSILKAETADLVATRLQLASAAKNVLENSLGLLTIGTVEEM
ncbi:MAG: arginine--tRNA ligase [Candidatus Magasanikbacteria bacterium RIFOXYD2_FULL_39_9]|uniref:Arginine--tRNA ligase n=1 Tax=Candidatus Magasanikbacteria bacterium RIFOXYD1_FULL_40_23 TaxID=1798705 RepID=A0A1F6P8R2_9BACT|nr:MAG: arginine--tRNA ligase [Candidatus Magasanikbacteria bacterium RIFOXYD1_FULL_40_23]OGH93005.1 MAG: arginine--tRNA ligase [Candidatus Magasanikbacteria bacterium RIFOXYD2_FULL_39_9]